MNTISKRISQNHAQTQTQTQATATIVEYGERTGTLNAYPDRIISPPHPSECCSSNMKQIGNVEEDGNWLFVYKRCRTCGYTVRQILIMSPKAMRTMRVDLMRSMNIDDGRN